MVDLSEKNLAKAIKKINKLCQDRNEKISIIPSYMLIALPKIIITRGFIVPEILVCSQCKHPVTNGIDKFYACDKCQMLTTNVEWIDKIIV